MSYFPFLVKKEGQKQFTFTQKGQQNIFTVLLQEYIIFLILYHNIAPRDLFCLDILHDITLIQDFMLISQQKLAIVLEILVKM